MAHFPQKSLSALLLSATVLTPVALVAQRAPGAEAAPVVTRVEYHLDGGRKIDHAAIEAHLKLKVGDAYSQGAADASVRSLYATGLYRYAAVEPERSADNKVTLHIRLLPYLRVTGIKFRGNTEWDSDSWIWSDLSDEVEIKVGDVLNDVSIKRSKEKLIRKYDKYYPFTSVDSTVEPDGAGGATVIFDVQEGLSTKIQRIDIEGNKVMSSKELRQEIETATWAWTFDTSYYPYGRFLKFSWLTGWGRFHKDEFRTDLEKLREFYRNQGFLDVEIPDKAAETNNYVARWPEEKKGRLAVKIKITEGRRYSVGDVRIEGNALGDKFPRFKSDAILSMLETRRRNLGRPYPYGDRLVDFLFGKGDESDDMSNRRKEFDYLKRGDWYAPKAVEAAQEKLRDYYGEVGYLDAQVRVERRPNLQTGKIDLVFKIREGEKSYLRSVNISGNTKTRSAVIVRELALAPGEVFDLVRMKNSEARLRNTHFFEESRLSPESTNIPNQRNLRVAIKEGRTGSLTFGAGFSTVESLVGFAEYSESNFDLFNYRNSFRGGGQKFRFRVSAGTKTSSVEQSFEEPWVYERELAFGYRLYYTGDSTLSSAYNVVRGGFEPYFRRRIFGLVEARVAYNIENVEIKEIDPTAPQFIKDEEGTTLISRANLTLTRDARDNFTFPTYGSRLQLINELAGGPLGAEVNYYKLEARATKWLPIFDAGEQTLMIIARAGGMMSYDGGYVPFYERFTLGGAYTMRGFKYGHVGPFEGDEPTGGNSYGLFTAEYTIKIIEQLRFATFYDWGFVNAGDFDFDTSGYNDNWGIGFRILVMGAVMRIDVGFPLTTSPNNDDGVRFNFSFGTQF